MIIRKISNNNFGFRLNKKQVKLMSVLPKEQLDIFGQRLLNAPQENTRKASKERNKILIEALNLAKTFINKNKGKTND